MKKILFVAPNLNVGGAEKVLVTIINELSHKNYDCTLLLLKKEGKLLQRLDKNVEVISISSKNPILKLIEIKKTIGQCKPDVVFSIIGHVNVMMGILKTFCFRDRIKFIGRENAVHSVWFNEEMTVKKRALFILYKLFLKKIDVLIIQSNVMKSEVISLFNVKPENCIVLNNAIDVVSIERLASKSLDDEIQWDASRKNIIAVGRLEEVKNYPDMISLVHQLPNEYVLNIFGEGKQKDSLEKLIEMLNLKDRVILHGYVSNVYKYMSNSSCLLLTSKREAFPNVVIEANACGIPAICSNIPGGLQEVIDKSGVNGVICEDSICMISSIKNSDSFDSENIKGYVRKKFSMKNYINNVTKVIDD